MFSKESSVNSASSEREWQAGEGRVEDGGGREKDERGWRREE
jgi:hypothetical protein